MKTVLAFLGLITLVAASGAFVASFTPSGTRNCTNGAVPCPGDLDHASGIPGESTTCDKACHEWLMGDATRSVVLAVVNSGRFHYTAGAATSPSSCPDETKHFMKSAFGSKDLKFRDAILQEGFCPVVEPERTRGRPMLDPPLDWSAGVGAADRIKFMTDQAFLTDAMPSVERMMAGEEPIRYQIFSRIVSARGANPGPLVPLIMQTLRTRDPSKRDVASGLFSPARAIQSLGQNAALSSEVIRKVLDDVEADPAMAALTGYSALLSNIAGPKLWVYQLGRPSVCENASKIEKWIPAWGQSLDDDRAWVANTIRCFKPYPDPLIRALRDQRPEMVSFAIHQWAHAASRNLFPSDATPEVARATYDAVLELMRGNRMLDAFADNWELERLNLRRKHFTPWQMIAVGLVKLGKADEAQEALRGTPAAGKLAEALPGAEHRFSEVAE